jgi:hypothetical protein
MTSGSKKRNPDILFLFSQKSQQTNPLQVPQRGPCGERDSSTGHLRISKRPNKIPLIRRPRERNAHPYSPQVGPLWGWAVGELGLIAVRGRGVSSSHCLETGLWGPRYLLHQRSGRCCGPFCERKSGRNVKQTTPPPSSAEVWEKLDLYLHFPIHHLWHGR